MVEAYKIILRESGSVRRAEELARRMKSKSSQPLARTGVSQSQMRIVSEEIDKMQDEIEKSLITKVDGEDKKTSVKLMRSRRETRIVFIFKGGLEDTEERLQKVYNALTN